MFKFPEIRFSTIPAVRLAILIALSAVVVAAQTPSGVSGAAQPADKCPALNTNGFPIDGTLRVKVVGYLDSGHLKPGKDVWFETIAGEAFPGCTLNTGSAVYAKVISVSSTKKPDSSELSLSFDRADCEGHSKMPVKIALLGVWVPAANAHTVHDTTPTDMQDSQQSSGAASGAENWGQQLNPGGEAGTIKPGVIAGVSHITLDPQGGPSCSAKLTSTKRKIRLGPSAVFFLALMKTDQN